ncbi:hypothetical protein C7S18_01620 [Ahniella affigens]|uniref:Uncharacterized protein n=1 Tax=Ahniella affigens TaxID=2021234 RepID=A0A2P1PMA4_9GAMM|nr:alpha/beta hydrolase [Ahniella affigens]AVP95970.1 hypothetical protein C7S18_01620 [Ahniella affigens]
MIWLIPGLDGDPSLRRDFAQAMQPEVVHVAHYAVDHPNRYESLFEHVKTEAPSTPRFTIVGESFGGPLSIWLAEAFAERVDRLILCATFARAFFRPVNGLRHLLPWSSLPWLSTLPITKVLSRELIDPGFLAAIGQVPVPRLRERLDAAATVDVRDRLAGLKMPISYIQARPDLLVPASCLAEIQAVRPDVTVHRLPGTHFLLQQQPEAVAALIRRLVHTRN